MGREDHKCKNVLKIFFYSCHVVNVFNVFSKIFERFITETMVSMYLKLVLIFSDIIRHLLSCFAFQTHIQNTWAMQHGTASTDNYRPMEYLRRCNCIHFTLSSVTCSVCTPRDLTNVSNHAFLFFQRF